jgi:hypothetical protein
MRHEPARTSMTASAGIEHWPARAVPQVAGDISQRSLASYLLLPRPKDAVKWWIFPTVFLLGVVGAGRFSTNELIRAAVVWFVLELLIYQARYQWNDIVGFEADQRHPDCAGRGRLPGPASQGRQRKLASATVAVLRLLAAAAVGLVFPQLRIGLTTILLIGAVFAVAAFYEQLKRWGTGWASEAPPGLRPAIVGLWIAVGGGYAVRGVAGLALAVDLAARPGLAVAAAAAMWTYGIAFVTSRWVLEALAFARVEEGRLAWSCRPEQCREHLLSLARWLPEYVASPAAQAPRTWRPLQARTPLGAPWNAAATASGTFAGLAGLALAGNARLGLAVGLGAAFAVATILVLRSGARARVAVLFGAGAVIVGLELISGVHRYVLALAPWMAVVGAQLWFFSQNLETMGRELRGRFTAARGA